LLEALCFTSGVSICSNTRVTFKKIHNTRFTIVRVRVFVAQRTESDLARNRSHMRGYCFMDAALPQISLRMMSGIGGDLRGKQCMSGVDPFAIMRQHAPSLVNRGKPCREIAQ
jgi:hypothetical protein